MPDSGTETLPTADTENIVDTTKDANPAARRDREAALLARSQPGVVRADLSGGEVSAAPVPATAVGALFWQTPIFC